MQPTQAHQQAAAAAAAQGKLQNVAFDLLRPRRGLLLLIRVVVSVWNACARGGSYLHRYTKPQTIYIPIKHLTATLIHLNQL